MITEYRATTRPNQRGRYEVRAVSMNNREEVSRTIVAERSTYEGAMELVQRLSE